jgi:hypothetical protein
MIVQARAARIVLSGVVAAAGTLLAVPAAAAPSAAAPAVAAASPSAVTAAVDLSSYTAGGLVDTASLPQGPAPLSAPGSASGFGSYGGCAFYATSALAGGYCLDGSVYQAPESLAQWLDGRRFDNCRWVPVPEGMAINAQEKPGGEWMLKICIQNVDFNSPWGGTDTRLEVFQQWIQDGTDVSVTPTMQEFWDVVGERNYYPLPRMLVGPTQKAYVGTYTYFWAEWFEHENWTDEGRTIPYYRIPYQTGGGQVFLEASLTGLTIHPGQDDLEPKDCGDAEIPFRFDIDDYVPVEEGGEQPSECWFVYSHSSASEDHGMIRVRATASWQVHVENAAGDVVLNLGDYFYEIDRRIAVAEVQSIVDSDPHEW